MTFDDEQRESIERTIADLTAERDRIDEAVRVLRRLIGAEPEPAAGNAKPPAAAKKPAPGKRGGARKTRDVEADREKLVEVLQLHGPLPRNRLHSLSGIPVNAFAAALDDARFKKGPGKFDPWALA